MKKFLFFILLLSITVHTFAQSNKAAKKRIFTAAIEAGYNASTLFYNGNNNNGAKSTYAHSFHAGVLGTTNINWLNFEIGVFYSEKGGGITSNNSNANINRFKLSYVEVPINLLLKIPIGIKIYPYIGTTLGGLVKATDISSSQKINAYSQLKKFDVGINAGIGIDIFGFNIRGGAVVGTQPIYTNGPKNLVFTVALSYIF